MTSCFSAENYAQLADRRQFIDETITYLMRRGSYYVSTTANGKFIVEQVAMELQAERLKLDIQLDMLKERGV